MDQSVPLKKLVLGDEDETGVKTIALVDEPAIMVNWVAFSEEKEPVKFSIQDEDQRIILSPALIPDLQIPRVDKATGERYAVYMDKETIWEVAYRWQKQGRQNLAMLTHQKGGEVDGITWFSSFVSDEKLGIKNPTAFEKMPNGTWYLMGKVNNDQVWKEIKEGKYKGISIDAFFEMEDDGELDAEQIEAIRESILKH